MDISTIITTALNNPECSIFSGMWLGQILMLRELALLYLGYRGLNIIMDIIKAKIEKMLKIGKYK